MSQFLASVLAGVAFATGSGCICRILSGKGIKPFKKDLLNRLYAIIKVVLSIIFILAGLVCLYFIIKYRNSEYWSLFDEILRKLYTKG